MKFKKAIKNWLGFFVITLYIACNSHSNSSVPVIGFADAFQDNTIEQAKTGFYGCA